MSIWFFSWLLGVALVILFEQVWPMGTPIGVVLVLASMIGRGVGAAREQGVRRSAQRKALFWTAVSALAMPLYLLTLDATHQTLGLSDEAASRFYGSFSVLWPMALLIGGWPMAILDRAMRLNPKVMPVHAPRQSVETGLVVGLVFALLFPINYLASTYKADWDLAYFQTTRPGSTVLSIAETLTEPVKATLFFSPGSETRQEAQAYFDTLAARSDGKFTVSVVDQATAPEEAEAMKVRENGYVALQRGEATEKFRLADDIEKSRRSLKKLDETVQKHLLKLARDKRTVYFLTGHGESSTKDKDNPLKKITSFRKELQNQNYKVSSLGVADGSGDVIPDDAAFVVIAGPMSPLLDEEVAALKKYVDGGGRLLVMVEPGGDPLKDLLAHLGLATDGMRLANPRWMLPETRKITDRVLLVSNKYGSHASVKTLASRSSDYPLLLPTVGQLTEVPGTPFKATALIRGMPDTFRDANNNFRADPGEEVKAPVMAWAVSGPNGAKADKQARAIVINDVTMASDYVLVTRKWAPNSELLRNAARWLVGDEQFIGETVSEEDVKIQHSGDSDWIWFYTTIFGIPLIVLLFGGVITTLRGRKS